MQKLLLSDAFDHFLLCEGEICTFSTFSLNGQVNKKFFEEEAESLSENFILWANVKHICYEIIRGKRIPTKIKLVLALPKKNYEKIISDSGIALSPEIIGGLYLHILYEDNTVNIITGTTLNSFIMDKSLDNYWDKLLLSFFQKNFIVENDIT